jgi:hypothetical protein
MYMRETLNITGGSLTINYDPNYSNDFDNNPGTTFANALRSGPISAQFSGAVTLSGTGSLSVNTLQVDASKTFTLAGSTGTLTFKTINLLSSAKIAVTGDVNINPLSNNTATISGSNGNVDLSGGTRIFTVGNGSSGVDLDVVSPVINGGLTKNGAGTMRLSGSNTLTSVALNAGSLLFNGNSTTGAVTVSGGTLGGTGSVTGAVTVNSTGHLAPGASIESIGLGALTLNAGSVLDIELGAPGVNDLINIIGALTLNGGLVNLVDLGGLDVGTYTLAVYSSKVGSVANLGTPIGPSNFNYQLAASENSLNLFVSLPGDFDLDGTVDGNDYAMWRKKDGTQNEYNLWRANYGRTAGGGSGTSLGGTASVPEPATVLLVVCGAMFSVGRRFRRRR